MSRSDLAAFNSAADALISQYIPQPEWEALTSAVGSAASAAGVTADVKDIIYSALKATEAPSWFASVVPTAYNSQYQVCRVVLLLKRRNSFSLSSIPTPP